MPLVRKQRCPWCKTPGSGEWDWFIRCHQQCLVDLEFVGTTAVRGVTDTGGALAKSGIDQIIGPMHNELVPYTSKIKHRT
ncbi:hypothetical protein J1614_012202 [Plenodomus biglobosus]|nr:hypothetical protein J1614_012202 [Plenodomus biglobosus]